MGVIFVKHVAWEGPHRIGPAFAGAPVQVVNPLAGEPLPPLEAIDAAVFMGGPMSVNDAAEHPALADELRWIEAALDAGTPLLGVCLGSQLIARALGASVGPAPRFELGWAPVEVHAADDPLLGPLAPETIVLHWHGEEFSTPPGAQRLASSAHTECQAFRAGNAWGLLFHPEADRALVERWLAEPVMAAEATDELGAGGPDALRQEAARHEAELIARSSAGFAAFARLAAG